ncbi:MAG: hypothetical protein IRZ32_12125, partial [Solirubrobacteraceae bacterium]|nr:hypothetical protein [Solirubrobacteraceae bacterium]
MAEGPPNVLFLHSHDTGRHLEPYGFPVATPNLQQLAAQGVLFRRAFCVVGARPGGPPPPRRRRGGPPPPRG